MNAQTLLQGLLANYPEGQHPSSIQQKDMLRVLKNCGWSESQLDLIYDELLRACQFFPKIFDLHSATRNLNLIRPGKKTQEETTRELLDRQKDCENGITFHQWLYREGGYQDIIDDCEGDMVKVRKRLAIMGVTAVPEQPKPKTHHEENFSFLADDLQGIEVEFVSGSLEDL